MITLPEDAVGLIAQYFPRCALHRHAVRGDDRGWLVALEERHDVPFDIARVYYLFGQGPGVERGFHAHRALDQWAVCVSGGCRVRLYDGAVWKEAVLDRPELGLHIGPMIWHEMYDFAPNTAFVVLASAPYDEADYIRDRGAFERLTGPLA
ncbi:MAG: FdtA/QdtA family cupin domain-containing protein [Pseudomonadota bacterium]